MKWRLMLTALILVYCVGFTMVYQVVQGPVEAKLAVAQLEDSAVTYAGSRALAKGGLVPLTLGIGALMTLVVWAGPLQREWRKICKELREELTQ